MKRKLLVVVMALCVFLVGCSGKNNDIDGEKELQPSATEKVSLDYQNAMHNDAAFFYDNGWIYGQAGGPDGRSYFLKVRDDGTEATNLGQFAIRDPFLVDNYIYFMGISDNDRGIYRMRTSGEKNIRRSGDDAVS